MPSDSKSVYCLDLLNGESRWRSPRPRGDDIYIAGIDDGHVILVGKRRISAVDLESAQTVWRRNLAAPPSGRGIHGNSFYLLPLTSGELLKIDLQSGDVISNMQMAEPLGNLTVAQDQIISQTPRRLTSHKFHAVIATMPSWCRHRSDSRC